MAQVRRQMHNPSPPPRQIPSLLDSIRLPPPSSTKNSRRTKSFQINNLSRYAGSTRRTTHTPLSYQTGLPFRSINTNPLLNRVTSRESFLSRQYEQPKLNIRETEEPVAISTLINDYELPVVSIDHNRLPVFARFPFDVTFIPRTMDTNVEDNIHRLRLRLIDSELNHQRQSTNEYLKRTQNQLSILPPKPTEHNVRPPTNLTYQRVPSKILSRQTSYSPISIDTPMTSDRIGMENDPDLEREFELRRIRNSVNSGRQSNQQQLMLSNYSYDPRLHLQPLSEEQQYSSSNMDDLIDSMARRHLAHRRLDATINHQRRSHGPYFESSALGRRASLRSQQRNDDLYLMNTTPSNLIEPDFMRPNPNDFNRMLRSRGDYYNRIQSDSNSLGMNNIIRTNSFPKLPPISPVIDSNRSSRSRLPSNSTLYQAKHNPQGHRNYQQPLPLSLPDQNEHLIELPSDIFLTSRRDALGSSQPHHHRTHKNKARHISKDKSDVSADSESDHSDGENKSSIVNRRKQKQEQHSSNNNHHGFFTEINPKKNKPRRHLFKKAAIGIYFINTLKHRAAKTRLTRPSQTLSATIHKIRIQEIMVALHRVYLEPDGPIYNALIQTITNSIELKDALNTSSTYYPQAIQVIGEALKSIISKIVEFMPRDGVLGTAKNSAVSALIQDGNPFPDNYFWQSEKKFLEFNKSKIVNITKQRAMLLLIGIFIFRALITTLLMKPIKYRLILGQLSNTQTDSLKVLASVMFYVGRLAVKSTPRILALPHEWELSLYSDTDIEPIIEHSEIKSIITTCEHALRVWCEEYIRRIDESFGKELRT